MPRCFSIDIPSPCLVGWDNMKGGENVRFCNQCEKNVFNLSNMSEDEVADLIEVNGNTICVSIRRRPDGTLYTDNCPRHLRQFRNTLRQYAPLLLVACSWLFHQSAADAQGLIGASNAGRFGLGNEVSNLVEDVYVNAHAKIENTRAAITAVAALVTIGFSYWRVQVLRIEAFNLSSAGHCLALCKKKFRPQAFFWIALTIVLPVLIYFTGTLVIDNPGEFPTGL